MIGNPTVVPTQPQPEPAREQDPDPMAFYEAVYAGAIAEPGARIRAGFGVVSPRAIRDPERAQQTAAGMTAVNATWEHGQSLDRSGASAALRAREMAEQLTRQRAARRYDPAPGELSFRRY